MTLRHVAMSWFRRTALGPAWSARPMLALLPLMPLLALLSGRISTCNSSRIMAENDCYQAEATGIRLSNGELSITSVKICTLDQNPHPDVDERCWRIRKARLFTYNERNTTEGYTEGEDLMVRTHHAKAGPVPVKCLSIGSITNAPDPHGIRPTSWILEVETDHEGEQRTVSCGGDFHP